MNFQKKFLGMNFRAMYKLVEHVQQYNSLLKEEIAIKIASQGTLYKDPVMSYASTEDRAGLNILEALGKNKKGAHKLQLRTRKFTLFMWFFPPFQLRI